MGRKLIAYDIIKLMFLRRTVLYVWTIRSLSLSLWPCTLNLALCRLLSVPGSFIARMNHRPRKFASGESFPLLTNWKALP